ncbi:MAG: hypothetical protein GWP03_00950 [Proteobacteria bacterium]|nr:hypothetical protein [Pseudomonadota bacterium]
MKKLFISLIVVLVFSSCSFIKSVQTVEKPDISIKSVSIGAIGLTEATLNLALNVNNGNSFSINLSKLDYNIAINKYNVGSGIKNNLSLPASQTKIVELPITVKYSSFSDLFKSIIQKKALKYRVYGRGYLKTSFTTFSFPYSTEKELSF